MPIINAARSHVELIRQENLTAGLRLYAMGLSGEDDLKEFGACLDLADALLRESADIPTKHLLEDMSPVQDEVLKSYVLGIFLRFLQSMAEVERFASEYGRFPDATSRRTVRRIMTDTEIVAGTNMTENFKIGREVWRGAPTFPQFMFMIAHELGHQ